MQHTKQNFDNKQESKSSEQVIDFSEEAEEAELKQAKHKKGFSVLKLIFFILIAAIVLLSAFGIWNRWFRYDDAADIVSNWQVSGTGTTIKIDKKQIYLDKNTIFNYEIDEGAKLIYLKTGDYSGTCHYRFSWDRCQLALIDSGDMNAVATACSDICWFSDFITCHMNGIGLSPAYTKETGQDVDTADTGIEDIISKGHDQAILLDKVSTQKVADSQ